MRLCQHRLPFAAFPSGLEQVSNTRREAVDGAVAGLQNATGRCLGSVLQDHSVCREQTTTNLTPSCCGSSQNSCLLPHNDAWIKVTLLRAAFCHAAAILVRKSASPYLGSRPTEGQREGQRDEKAALMAGLGELPGATGSPNLPLCSSLACQHPFLCLTLPSLFPQTTSCGWVTLTTQVLCGRHQGGSEMKFPF